MMKKINYLLVSAAVTLSSCGSGSSVSPAIAVDSELEAKVEKVLSEMSLEEKIGQMTQFTLDVLGTGQSPFELDPVAMDSILGKYKVGSILNTPLGGTPLTAERWCEIVKAIQERAIAETGIPVVYGLDQIHGATYTVGGTMFPQEIGMGATFNPDLVRRGAEITAYETKASSVPWNFSPVLDLGRDPRWSRMWETYGEDSYLVSVLGVACNEGYQGKDPNNIPVDRVASCLKHFMGYGVTVSGKDRTPSSITEQDMRERHFAPFLAAIRNGALSVMVNSGMNNGVPYHMNHEYLTRWLKEDLNWDGMVVTDWADINNIHNRDRVAATKKEAVKLAINAGIDMAMVPYEVQFCKDLKELVEEGEVPMSRIDDAVRRVLRMKFRLNLFDKPYYEFKDFPLFASEEFAKVSLESAEQSITLLKNTDAILPLAKGKKILVSGPNANSMRTLNGGWTLSWQGEKVETYAGQFNTILEAMQNKFGASNIVYEAGVTYDFNSNYMAENSPEISKAVAAARSVDYIVLCLGENSYCETPGNLYTLDLSKNQAELAKALAATGKPVILVLNEGRPRIISDFEPQMKAVVQTYLPGHYGGDALANILSGEVNPSGKLPYSYPKFANSLTTYDYKPCESQEQMGGAYNYDAVVSMQWAFGYGLSYTTFEYSNLTVNKTNFKSGDELVFNITVRNSGSVDGKESVLLFSSDEYASVTPDVRRLRAFSKIELKAGEAKTVELKVKATDLAFVGADGKWILEKGDFTIQVGNQSVKVVCDETKKWSTPNI